MSELFENVKDFSTVLTEKGFTMNVDAANTADFDSDNGSVMDRKETVTAEEKAALKALLGALEPFRARKPTITLQQVMAFLLVALNEGRQVTEYARMAGIAQGVMTRNLLDLGEYTRNREPGLDLLEQKPDLMNRRAHLTFLTHKGSSVVGAITRAWQKR